MRLCTKTILLKNGTILKHGYTSEVIDSYLKAKYGTTVLKKWENQINGNNIVKILEVRAHDTSFNVKENFSITESVGISMIYEVIETGNKIHSAFNFYDRNGINIFDSHENNTNNYHENKNKGFYETTVWIPKNLLSEGIILVGVALVTHDPFVVHFHEKESIAFNMIDIKNESRTRGDYVGSLPGIIRPLLKWESKYK